jgi:beta-phosphoglucomutase
MIRDSFNLDQYKALLFDLDGTLVDSMKANFFAYRDVLASLNLRLEVEPFERHWGTEAEYFLPTIFPQISTAEIEIVQREKPLYFERYLDKISLNVELSDLIWSCKQSHKMGLVTSSKRGSADRVLDHFKLNEVFDVVITGSDTERRKPDPEPYITALLEIGCSAKETLVFEDSSFGIDAAKAAGIEVIVVTRFT